MENIAPFFFAVWLATAIPAGILWYRGVRKAKKTFEGVDNLPILFREKGASGYSKKSFLTRIGGASKALDIIVTDAELCIKGINAMFSFIGTYYDLSHRIKRSNVLSARQVGRTVEVKFVSDAGQSSDIVLILKKGDQFLAALNG